MTISSEQVGFIEKYRPNKFHRPKSHIQNYATRGLIIVAVLIGSCILCPSSSFAGDNVSAVTIIFRAMGFCGIVIGLFFAQRLVRDMKKGKQLSARRFSGHGKKEGTD